MSCNDELNPDSDALTAEGLFYDNTVDSILAVRNMMKPKTMGILIEVLDRHKSHNSYEAEVIPDSADVHRLHDTVEVKQLIFL